MKKVTVRLSDDQHDALRRLAVETGRTQSDLIRDGLARTLPISTPPKRHFASRGIGASGKTDDLTWDTEALQQRVLPTEDSI
jgi:hypothetical protein